MGRLLAAVSVVLALSFLPLTAQQEPVAELESPKQAQPGQTALLTSPKGMHYFLRLPEDYDRRRGARLVVFMHGSNMNGLLYLPGLVESGWCKHDIVVCPNGESSEDIYGANNFTFASAPYIAEITELIQKTFKVTRTYVGGHSQGGFVTYSVIMNYPHLYQGALPMAGDCWSQNEPNLYAEKPKLLARQRQIAIAIIHGRADPVVQFSQGQHAHDVFMVMGYPKLRLFAPQRLGHQFMLSPVGDALDWLDAMVGGANPKIAARVGERAAQNEEWGWALEAGRNLTTGKGVTAGDRKKGKGFVVGAERAARLEARQVARAMEKLPAEKWLWDWWEFRRKFGSTRVARPLVKRYEKLRAQQRQLGRKLFDEAWGYLNGQNQEQAHALLGRLLAEAPCSYHAYYALGELGIARDSGAVDR